MTVATYLLWFLGSLMTIVSVGATALVARMTGAGEPAAASRVCQQAIGLALILGTATLIAGEVVAPCLIRALNLEGRGGRERRRCSSGSSSWRLAAPGLHDGGRRLPPGGGRHPDRDVGDGPGQRGQRRR